MLNITKKNLLSIVLIAYFLGYIFFASFVTNFAKSDLDYKNFSTENSCTYTINQIDFYDFDEADKSYQIYKHHTNFIKDPQSIKCLNKIQLIEDGWPVIRVEVSGDSLLFQIIKNTGFILLFLFFVNFFSFKHKFFLIVTTLFNLITYRIFSIDFISEEFKFLYSYEIIFSEILITYLIFLMQTNNEYLRKTINLFQEFVNKLDNKSIIFISGLIGIRAIYIFFNYSYANNISEWLINYNYGFIRRGLIGSFLLTFFNDLNFISYTIIPILIFFLHFFVIYISLKIFQESEKNIYSLFVLFSPLYIIYPIFNVSKGVGNKELLGIICFLLILRSSIKEINLKYNFFIVVLYIVSILSHEVNLFTVALLSILFFLKKIKIDFKLLVVLISISIVFIGIYFQYPISPEITDSLCKETFMVVENLDCTKAYYLQQDSLESFYSSINRIFEDNNYLLVYGVYFVIALLPFLISGWLKENIKLFTFSLFAILPLFFIAIDWGRWLHIIFVAISSIYFINNSNSFQKSLNIGSAILLILYTTLWRVPQCCVEEINIVYLFRFNKFNYLIYLFLIYTFISRKKEYVNKINEFIKF